MYSTRFKWKNLCFWTDVVEKHFNNSIQTFELLISSTFANISFLTSVICRHLYYLVFSVSFWRLRGNFDSSNNLKGAMLFICKAWVIRHFQHGWQEGIRKVTNQSLSILDAANRISNEKKTLKENKPLTLHCRLLWNRPYRKRYQTEFRKTDKRVQLIVS